MFSFLVWFPFCAGDYTGNRQVCSGIDARKKHNLAYTEHVVLLYPIYKLDRRPESVDRIQEEYFLWHERDY